MGITSAKTSRTICDWYVNFRVKHKFTVEFISNKENLPQLLQENKNNCTKIEQYAHKHLHELSCELMCNNIHETILPEMVKEQQTLVGQNEETANKVYDVTCLATMDLPASVQALYTSGWKHWDSNTGYYVDGHEKPATVEYRKAFITQYLTYESHMFHRIQIKLQEQHSLEKKDASQKEAAATTPMMPAWKW